MIFDKQTTGYCYWLHTELESLPSIQYPFDTNILPVNGIYFFYQKDEFWGHGGTQPRIIRIGTHKDGNFRNRIKEHFLLDELAMNFDKITPKPSDRSIFRKHIGRAILNNEKDDYLKIWEIDFTTREKREAYSNLRNIKKEKDIESRITKIIRQKFSFKFIIVNDQNERMGSKGLESYLIGTVSHCELCKPSNYWLGHFSPKKQIRTSGLWLVQHVNSEGIDNRDKKVISKAIEKTKKQIRN